ncbi:MAG: recombinase [Clostridia bacterium]|nr:recombinase [Clostridia bacterium]
MDEIDFKEYEEKCKLIKQENESLLEMFEKDLEGLNPKTINRHLTNVDFYINTYLLREDAYDFTHGIWDIDDYLGNFFIRKCMWSTPGNIKSTAASIKKFYQCMLKQEMIQNADYEYLCETIKDNMWKWQSDCEIYNDPDAESPFMPF